MADARLNGCAQALRRILWIGDKALGGRRDAGVFHPGDAALTDAVKAANGIDLVVKKLNAKGVLCVGGEHVQNGAAHGALPLALHHGHPLIAGGQKPVDELLRGMAFAFGKVDLRSEEHRLGHAAVDQAVQADAEDPRAAMSQAVEGMQALPGALPAGGGTAELQIPWRQADTTLTSEPLDILGTPLGDELGRANQHHGPAGTMAQGSRQKGAFALGQFIDRAAARLLGKGQQFLPLGHGAVCAEKSLVHELAPSFWVWSGVAPSAAHLVPSALAGVAGLCPTPWLGTESPASRSLVCSLGFFCFLVL